MNPAPFPVDELKLALARNSLLAFVLATYPGYLMGWVHAEICIALDQFLDDVMAKRSPRLLLTMPPRSGKSELASYRFPAYALGRYPDISFIGTSYSADLASRINRGIQRIMETPEYARIFPETRLSDQNVRAQGGSYLRNSDIFEIVGHKGSYRSAGVGGGISGMGGECLLIDDPIKDHEQADSPTIRNKIWDWYTSTLYTRAAPGGGIILILTRWNPIKDDTPVLTPQGWRKHGELKPGDQVFGIDGRPVTVTHVTAPVWCNVAIKTRQETIICAETHLWPVKTRAEYSTINVTARDLIGRKHRLSPVVPPLQYPGDSHLPIDPYWLGLWLGEGSKSAPMIACGREYTAHCESTGYAFTRKQKTDGHYFYAYSHQGLRGKLVALGLLGHKHIPQCYKQATTSDRLQLLAGLIDTDGDASARACTYRYSSATPELYADVKELVRGLGMQCSRDSVVNPGGSTFLIKGEQATWRATCLRFSFQPHHYEIPCRVEYKRIPLPKNPQRCRGISASMASPDACGWGRCISTSAKDGLYLVGRTLIPTHNCDDLAGRLIRAMNSGTGDNWKIINFPAIATRDEEHRKCGEALHPERYSLEQLQRIRNAIGPRDWEALYQQRPVPASGGIFKTAWMHYYTQAPDSFDEQLISWDMTFKDNTSSDYVVGQVWARKGADFFLLDQVRDRLSFTETLTAFQSLAARWPQATRKLVEDKANGPAVIDSLKHRIPGIIPVEPDGSKTARAYAVTALFEAGNVHLPDPEIAPWIRDYVAELTNFPVSANDDQVDATTQALRRLQVRSGLHIAPDTITRPPLRTLPRLARIRI